MDESAAKRRLQTFQGSQQIGTDKRRWVRLFQVDVSRPARTSTACPQPQQTSFSHDQNRELASRQQTSHTAAPKSAEPISSTSASGADLVPLPNRTRLAIYALHTSLPPTRRVSASIQAKSTGCPSCARFSTLSGACSPRPLREHTGIDRCVKPDRVRANEPPRRPACLESRVRAQIHLQPNPFPTDSPRSAPPFKSWSQHFKINFQPPKPILINHLQTPPRL